MFSKPGSGGQAVSRFLQGSGQNRAGGGRWWQTGLQPAGTPDPLYCRSHLPRTGLLGLSAETYLETINSLVEGGGALLFSSVAEIALVR